MPVLNHESTTSPASMEGMDLGRAPMKGERTKMVRKKKNWMVERSEEARLAWLEGASGSSEDEESGEAMVVERPFNEEEKPGRFQGPGIIKVEVWSETYKRHRRRHVLTSDN